MDPCPATPVPSKSTLNIQPGSGRPPMMLHGLPVFLCTGDPTRVKIQEKIFKRS